MANAGQENQRQTAMGSSTHAVHDRTALSRLQDSEELLAVAMLLDIVRARPHHVENPRVVDPAVTSAQTMLMAPYPSNQLARLC